MTASHVPYGTVNPTAYSQGRLAARQFALEHDFEETSFCEIPVQWGEQDANNHLNNVVFARYCEAGRLAYIRSLASSLDPAVSKNILGSGKGTGLILAGVSIAYERPVFAPDTVLVAHKHSEVGPKKILLESMIYSFSQQARVAHGTAAMVAFDYEAQKSSTLPTEVVQLLREKEREREGKTEGMTGGKAKL
ncbi:HotDog domain-containing protein [Leucosporidium creatinivorum]|uniref:HotDog domain-containing protein n=1 Tax=Leucosporidium creatinivorum TaxID=106004 RepID=A0A1Y2ED27_9BASI|nr:HotDog domain-containing protein [Leucosporidium creatinivorum]